MFRSRFQVIFPFPVSCFAYVLIVSHICGHSFGGTAVKKFHLARFLYFIHTHLVCSFIFYFKPTTTITGTRIENNSSDRTVDMLTGGPISFSTFLSLSHYLNVCTALFLLPNFHICVSKMHWSDCVYTHLLFFGGDGGGEEDVYDGRTFSSFLF